MPSLFLTCLFVLFTSVFLLVPSVMLLGIRRSRERERTWIPTQGTITAMSTGMRRPSGPAAQYYLLVDYEYRDHLGQIHTGQTDPGEQSVVFDEVPQPIELLVNPLNPSDCVVKGFNSPTGIACAVVALVAFLGVGLLGATLSIIFAIS